MDFSVVVTNYNGAELLHRYFSSVVLSAEYTGKDHEIILVDDCSSDSSVQWVQKNFSQVKIIRFLKNRGFAAASNAGIKAAQGKYVILLNNDLLLEKNCIARLLENMHDGIFATGAKVMLEGTNTLYFGKCRYYFRRGVLHYVPHENLNQNTPGKTMYASGGMGCFDRKILKILNGFSRIYEPFYWEDADLSYRALKSGYTVVYVPDAVMHHRNQGTISLVSSLKFREQTILRNSILFFWANITDRILFFRHFSHLFYTTIRECIKGEWRLIPVLYSALKRIPMVCAQRKNQKKHSRVSDRKILGDAVYGFFKNFNPSNDF